MLGDGKKVNGRPRRINLNAIESIEPEITPHSIESSNGAEGHAPSWGRILGSNETIFVKIGAELQRQDHLEDSFSRFFSYFLHLRESRESDKNSWEVGKTMT